MLATDEPAVTGTLFRSDDKYQHVVMVNECCYCNRPHRHITQNPEASWLLRHPRCKPWKSYAIRIRNTIGNQAAFWASDDVRNAA